MSSSIEEQIKAIEDEIFNTQKNKATEHHIGKLKAKLAKLRQEVEKRKSSATKGKGFSIKKSGDATVGIVGFPSIGKSTLINKLTAADSKIGDYDFTTLEVIPGVMKYQGANIQLLDFPGLIEGASKGKGRGREILSAIRNVDMILLLIDPFHMDHLSVLIRELHDAGLRLNQHKPDVIVTKTGQGGITVNSTVPLTYLSESLIKSISSEFVINANILIREDIDEDQLIDSFTQNRIYASAAVIINKCDLAEEKTLNLLTNQLLDMKFKTQVISALFDEGLEELKSFIFSELGLIRVYMKPVGKPVDYNEPLILKRGNTVEDACRRLHRDFKDKFRYGSVTGPSAKHNQQKVGLDHELQDKDVLTIITSK